MARNNVCMAVAQLYEPKFRYRHRASIRESMWQCVGDRGIILVVRTCDQWCR